MSAILKNWREAATLILVTGRNVNNRVRFQPVNSSKKITNADESALKGDNFEIMLLKRSSKSKFMPSLYVFPGGVADDADFSEKWNDIFCGVNNELIKNTLEYVQRGGRGPPMFSRTRDPQFSCIPSELAFRICAIRETFEESGVLLARNVNDLQTVDSKFMYSEPVNAQSYGESSANEGLLETWRKKVYANASEFLTMCQELNIVPDVWSLYEWSNWLTPRGQDKFAKFGRRYDTAFFVACIPDKPDAIQDHGETVHLQWGSPVDVLKEYFSGTTKIAPPQLYELSRFLNFEDINKLHRFIWQREAERVERFLPVRIRCQDAFLFLLPGDDLYPPVENGDPDEEVELSETLAELNTKFPNQHRTLISSKTDSLQVACNIQMSGGHVQPVTELTQILNQSGSKL